MFSEDFPAGIVQKGGHTHTKTTTNRGSQNQTTLSSMWLCVYATSICTWIHSPQNPYYKTYNTHRRRHRRRHARVTGSSTRNRARSLELSQNTQFMNLFFFTTFNYVRWNNNNYTKHSEQTTIFRFCQTDETRTRRRGLQLLRPNRTDGGVHLN